MREGTRVRLSIAGKARFSAPANLPHVMKFRDQVGVVLGGGSIGLPDPETNTFVCVRWPNSPEMLWVYATSDLEPVDLAPTLETNLIVWAHFAQEQKLLVLLVTRPDGSLALPGGLLDLADSGLAACAVRCTKESTGLDFDSDRLKFLEMRDAVDRDPRGRYVSAIYYRIEHLNEAPKPTLPGAAWHNMITLDPKLLALDHAAILESLADLQQEVALTRSFQRLAFDAWLNVASPDRERPCPTT